MLRGRPDYELGSQRVCGIGDAMAAEVRDAAATDERLKGAHLRNRKISRG
jgi:hypothetical protein